MGVSLCNLAVLHINNLNYAVHDSSKAQLIKTLRQLIVFIPILLLVKSDNLFENLFTVTIISSCLPLFIFVIFTLLFFKKHRELKPIWADFNVKIAKSVLKLGVNFFVLRLSSILLIVALPFLITRYVGINETADYNIGFKFFGIVQMSLAILLVPYWSAVTEKYGTRDLGWIKKSLFKTILWSILGVLAIFALSLVSPYILPIWIGKTVSIDFSTIYWTALLVATFVLTEPFLIFLNGMGEIKIQTYSSILIIIFLIPCGIFLLKYSSLSIGSLIIPPVVFRLARAIHAAFQLRSILNEK